MHIPRPYPDELLGSFLHRAARQLGVTQKRLISAWTGSAGTYFPMAITNHAGFATACGMDYVQFLDAHTLLPYLTSFMSNAERTQVMGTYLGPKTKRGGSSSASRYTTQAAKLRFCLACIRHDLKTYGDAYWHRSHQLPGVAMCDAHKRWLYITDVSFNTTQPLAPPNEADGWLIKPELHTTILRNITRISVSALRNELPKHDWPAYYHARAVKLGYHYKASHLISDVLSTDLQTYYGQEYLEAMGQEMAPDKPRKWPAMMFRSSSRNTTAFKHVLLNVFLASSPSPSISPTEVLRRPRGRPKNWAYIEIGLIEKLNEEIERCRAAGERMTATELMTKIGAKQPLKSHRKKLPTLAALVKEFRASSESVRKTGGRPRIYKKRNQRPSNQAK